MRAVLALLLAGSSLCAYASSNQPANTPVKPADPRAACGQNQLPFTVKLDNVAPESPVPEPGKALVFFIQDAGSVYSVPAYPTTRIGMDGAWVGANKDSSYTALTVEPGEHHACVMVQSSFVDSATELSHFTAVAGMTYYFRTRLLLAKSLDYLEIAPIDSDEGWYLVHSFPRSTIKPKK